MIEFDLNSFLTRRPEFSVYSTEQLREAISYLRCRVSVLKIQEVMVDGLTDTDLKMLRDDEGLQKYIKFYQNTRRMSLLISLTDEVPHCVERLKKMVRDPFYDGKVKVAAEGIIARIGMKSVELEQKEFALAEINEKLDHTQELLNERSNAKEIAESGVGRIQSSEEISKPAIIDSTLQR